MEDQSSTTELAAKTVDQQQSLFSVQNFESSVGKIVKAETKASDNKKELYLEYQGIKSLLKQAEQVLETKQNLRFKLGKIIPEANIESNNFMQTKLLTDVKAQSLSASPSSPFGALLNQGILGQKVLGNFTSAYIEARTNHEFQKALNPEYQVDHFVFAEGISSINLLDDMIKAHDISKNDLAVVAIPANAIKAFRNSRFSGWQVATIEQNQAQIVDGKVYQLDKTGAKVAEVNLIESRVTNLSSPIYKIKTGDRWIIAITYQTGYQDLNQGLDLDFAHDLKEAFENNCNPSKVEKATEITVSPGQAARLIFKLLGGDYEMIPEALLNFEGGANASIVLEESSSGRYNGTNSMHEVLKHNWHQQADVAIPWTYLGFDRFDESNQDLVNEGLAYLLSFDDSAKSLEEKTCFIEASQNWKKPQNELIQFLIREVYKELKVLASKKFLLSAKETMQVVAKYLAQVLLHNFDVRSENFETKMEELNINPELAEFLEIVACLHMLMAAKSSFYSSKKHPLSMRRLKLLSKIEKKIKKFIPQNFANFQAKILEILAKDEDSSQNSLIELYKSANPC